MREKQVVFDISRLDDMEVGRPDYFDDILQFYRDLHLSNFSTDRSEFNSNIYWPSFSTKYFTFSGYSVGLKFRVVYETGGPIIGLGGFLLDLDTGYILLSQNRDCPYIPVFDLFSYWRDELNIQTNNIKAVTAKLEKYKLGLLSVDQLLQELKGVVSENPTTTSRVVRSLGLRDMAGIFDDKQTAFDFLTPFCVIYEFLKDLSDAIRHYLGYIYWDDGRHFKITDFNDSCWPDDPKWDDVNLNPVTLLIKKSILMAQYSKYCSYQLPESDYTDLFRSMALDANSSCDNQNLLLLMSSLQHLNSFSLHAYPNNEVKSQSTAPSKSAAVALNFVDLAEALGKDYHVDFGYMALENGDVQMIKKIAKMIGISDLLSGAHLRTFTQGIKRDETIEVLKANRRNRYQLTFLEAGGDHRLFGYFGDFESGSRNSANLVDRLKSVLDK